MSADNQQERSLDSWYITGWFDGEGCFSVSVHPHAGFKHKWLIDPVVQTYQHKDSIEVLKKIQSYFGCGRIRPKGGASDVLTFSIESRKDIIKHVIPHFLKYPLQSRKAQDFELFRYIVESMEENKHRNSSEFLHLVKLAFRMNPHGKNRKYRFEDVEQGLKKSPEAIRQTRSNA